jgi:hypothetical protein
MIKLSSTRCSRRKIKTICIVFLIFLISINKTQDTNLQNSLKPIELENEADGSKESTTNASTSETQDNKSTLQQNDQNKSEVLDPLGDNNQTSRKPEDASIEGGASEVSGNQGEPKNEPGSEEKKEGEEKEDGGKNILSDKSDELGKIKGEIKKEQNNELAISIILISALILINNFLIDKINNLKKKCKCLEFLQNPLVTLLLGIISGIFVKIFEANSIIQTIKSGFQEFFMIILLPPILFASALNMNKFYFFKNFGKILILSFIGTFIAIIVNTALLYVSSLFPWGLQLSIFQSIIFSVLISATDPVSVLITFEGYSCNPNLYSLIFGESILNDAITLALYRSLRSNQAQTSDFYIMKQTLLKFVILILGSCLIAIVVGFFISFIMKRIYKRVQELDDKINFNTTVLESSKFENLNFQTMEDSERQKKINYDLIKINSLIQKKNNLISRQTSLMMISPLMAYLVAEVPFFIV